MYEHLYQHKIDDRIRQGKDANRIHELVKVEEAFYRYKNDTFRELALNHVYYAVKSRLQVKADSQGRKSGYLHLDQHDFESVFNEIVWRLTEKYEPTDDSLLLERFDRSFEDRSKNVVRDAQRHVRVIDHKAATFDDSFMDSDAETSKGDYRGVPIDKIKTYYANKGLDEESDALRKAKSGLLVVRMMSALDDEEQELLSYMMENGESRPTVLGRHFGVSHTTINRRLEKIKKTLNSRGLNPLGRVINDNTKNNKRKAAV